MNRKLSTALLILSAGGLTFASYTASVKLFTSACAFSEPCPYFLGYPACYYGWGLFLLLTLYSYLLTFGYLAKNSVLKGLRVISALGILFAGYFTIKELPVFFAKGFGAYVLKLPTCALGLIFFIAIFICAIKVRPE